MISILILFFVIDGKHCPIRLNQFALNCKSKYLFQLTLQYVLSKAKKHTAFSSASWGGQ